MYDTGWLFNAPAFAPAIAWSQDNLLAVAAGHTVVLLSPGALAGPRAFLGDKDVNISALHCGCMPKGFSSNLPFLLNTATEVRSIETGYKAAVRSLAWSPAGFTPQAGCLLATVTQDHLVSGTQGQ